MRRSRRMMAAHEQRNGGQRNAFCLDVSLRQESVSLYASNDIESYKMPRTFKRLSMSTEIVALR